MEISGSILIIGDSPGSLSLLAEILTTAGFEIRSAVNGKQALAAIAAEPPALMLLAIRMPATDGPEFWHQLKAREETSGIPLLAIIAAEDTAGKLEAFNLGAVDYVARPFQKAELLARVRAHLAIRSLNQELGQKAQQLESANNKLHEREVQYRNLADSGLALIWMAGTDKLCHYFNAPWLRFTGRTASQELGNGWTEGVHPEDFDRCLQTYLAAFDKRETFEMEYRLRHASGEYRWIRNLGTPNYNSSGEFIGYIGHCFDINDWKQAEIALRNSEAYIKTVMESLPIGISVNSVNPVVDFHYMNDNFSRFYRTTREKLASPDSFWEAVYDEPEVRENIKNRVLADCATGNPEQMHWIDVPITRKGEETSYIEAMNIPLPALGLMISTVSDVTGRKQAEVALKNSRQLLTETEKIGKVGGWEFNIATGKQTWTDEVYHIHEVDLPFEPTVDQGLNFYTATSRPAIAGAVQRAVEAGEPFDLELEITTAKGNLRSVHVIGKADLEHARVFGFFQDITARKNAEMEREQFYKFFKTSADLMVIADPNGAFLKINPAGIDTLGYPETELVAKPFVEFVHPDDKQATIEEMARQQQSGYSSNFENRYRCKDGSYRWLSWRATYTAEEGVTYATGRDITARKQAEEKLARSEEEFRKLSLEFNCLLDAIPDSLMLLDRELKILWVNRAAADSIGMPSAAIDGRFCYDLLFERTAPCTSCPALETFLTGKAGNNTVTRSDGRIWDTRTVPLTDELGSAVNVIAVNRDITEHRKLEEQLRQSQKMESVGTLAGGIAHDFNNILTAIIGYGTLALMKMAADDPQRLNIQHMLDASDRAVHLTRELLLFSRKQAADKKPVALNEVITKVEKFLQKVIGEDIAIKTKLHEAPLAVMADVHQLEQVLMNLATNARDSMPQGGELSLTTNVFALDREFIHAHGYGKAGIYALLTVADNGKGMDAGTRQRVFEPFFTTKEVGKGTGLGLAVVYGIIKQHDGFINVYSEPGTGTTFKIFLPLVTITDGEECTQEQEEVVKGGAETILLAEDDELVRILTKKVLKEFGYTVIEAVDGAEAVQKFTENSDSIELLLFDLIMPNLNGTEAFAEIRKIRPEIKAIFSSGYAPDTIRQKVSVAEGVQLIAKPIAPTELLRMVRSVLDNDR